MPIEASTPITVPPQPQVVFDELAIPLLSFSMQDLNGPIRAVARIVKCRRVNGELVAAPADLDKARGTVVIADLAAYLGAHTAPFQIATLGGQGQPATIVLADLVAALLKAVKAIAESDGAV